MNQPALRFANVVKRYAGVDVLRGIDLEVGTGELFGLVGVNGAGKTSLIKCLFDFIALDQGSIEIFGRSHLQPAARQALLFLPENFRPPPYFKGAEFLRYMLQLHAVPYQQDQVLRMLAALDLAPDALTRQVRDYSKGMTQKLGLAGCLLAALGANAALAPVQLMHQGGPQQPAPALDKHMNLPAGSPPALQPNPPTGAAPQPRMLVLDEPMSGLDPKARALVKRQLQHLRARGGAAFFSSHALADVAELCDRMAILHEGGLVFVGTPAVCVETYCAVNLEQAFLSAINDGNPPII
jgi:ABC-2 type transport system ATP-binding protein